jgi:hypothetical protein
VFERLIAVNAKNMSKAKTKDKELDMRPYYDFSGGVRGKYVRRFAGICKVVELDPDVAEMFPDAASVNETLRDVMAERGTKPGSR